MAGDGGWGVGGWGGTLISGGVIPPAPVPGDGAIVQNYTPIKGAGISPGTPIEFDVVGVNGAELVAIVISVLYPDTGASETVYDRNGFGINFKAQGSFLGSERQTITGGLHFIIRRRGGWPLSPEIKVEGGTNAGGPIEQP